MPTDEDAQRIQLIHRLCEDADEMHERTARLFDILSNEPRTAASSRLLLFPKTPPRKRKT